METKVPPGHLTLGRSLVSLSAPNQNAAVPADTTVHTVDQSSLLNSALSCSFRHLVLLLCGMPKAQLCKKAHTHMADDME